DVIVADEVGLADAAVGGAVFPVVNHVVADIEIAGELAALGEPAGHAPVATGAVGQQVVVEAADVTGDAAGKGMALARAIAGMAGDVEGLGDDAALQGDVAGAARADRLVDAPADGAVVIDGVVGAGKAGAVHGGAGGVADADADV